MKAIENITSREGEKLSNAVITHIKNIDKKANKAGVLVMAIATLIGSLCTIIGIQSARQLMSDILDTYDEINKEPKLKLVKNG